MVLRHVEDDVVAGVQDSCTNICTRPISLVLAVADRILIAIRVIPPPIPFRERPRLIGDLAVGGIDDQAVAGCDAEPAG
jgi:hypothetical protein